eukprot:CAMPEP_0116998044 /NCGR_PEP_ID=MMETSP0472-20121206/1258_1 /TAXON_ID=693140 ORGANISM="Tiarina fusus, Strain LIS" /NCGR_SAMPLE_ID=MMETSP0472 /ASSEMBLY_ACC=CAM_ASM_000603 /LENGTH=482 /DNA_ID=CAMNT_0004697087 /DNA_START=121 /DNA_END=1569 /DNA_ORIENTATION=+
MSTNVDGAKWHEDDEVEIGMETPVDLGKDADGESETPKSNRKVLIIGIIVVAIAAIAIGVAVAVSGSPDSARAAPSPAPTIASTPGPTPTYASEVRDSVFAIARFGGSEFDDPDSYQSRALGWVLTQDLPATDIPLSREDQASQLYALACIYYNTYATRSDWTDFHFGPDVAIPGWFNNRGWLISANEVCTGWYGISCNEEGKVSKIELDTNGLTGYFPPETALLADSLTYLDLFSNLVHNRGDLGNSWLGEMTNIEYLFYGTTSFEYDGVPTEIGLLTNLKEYDFSYTLYFGEFEGSTWTQLTNLNYLVMDGNAYNSSLPDEMLALPNLQYLYSGFSFLEGSLDFVPQMPAVFELWVDDNPGLAGVIPDNIADASTMVSFSATNCGLTGTLPTQLGGLSEMIQLWFYNNKLTGTIPTELANLVKMKILNVQKNELTGDMPERLCQRKSPFGRLEELEADCDGEIECPDTCCTCCGDVCIED